MVMVREVVRGGRAGLAVGVEEPSKALVEEPSAPMVNSQPSRAMDKMGGSLTIRQSPIVRMVRRLGAVRNVVVGCHTHALGDE